VTGETYTKGGAFPPFATINWTSQAASAGTSTVYDLPYGTLSHLRVDVSFLRSAQEANNVTPPHNETQPIPPAGDGVYWLIRAQNACGTSSYGNSYDPTGKLAAFPTGDPRDGLEDDIFGAGTLVPIPDPVP
jgi:hypothetical protein